MTNSDRAKPRSKAKKIILIGLAIVLIAVVGLVIAAPTIASSIAPGKIEAAAAQSMKGTVKVASVSVGWFSATEVGPVQVIDPEGKVAATATVKMPATLWKIVSEKWWSATKLDVGTIELNGALDLIRDEATGKTNLERALEPRATASKPGGGGSSGGGSGSGGGGIESVKAALKITKLDATVRDRDEKGVLKPEVGVKSLAGTVDVDYAAKPMAIAAKADLSGTPVGGAHSEPMKIKLDANVKPKSGGGFDVLAVKLDSTSTPIGIIDAVAKQGGMLVKAIGPSANVNVDAQMTGDKAGATVKLVGSQANADLDLSLAGGTLALRQPGGGAAGQPATNHISLKSTDFLASMPALREVLAKASEQVKVMNAPGIEITIEKLSWPLPPDMLGGASGKTAATPDYRGSGMEMKVRVGAMSGQVAIDQGGVDSAGKKTAPTFKPFAVEPIDLAVSASDLSKPVTITGGTKATIDGTPAGDVSIRATAAGLLDGAGHLRALATGAGIADNVDADVRVRGMSTALVQPLIAGTTLPIDLKQDVGSTLDLGLQAKADVQGVTTGGAAGAKLPPIDFTISVNSTNMKIDGTGRYAADVVSLTGNGLRATIASAAPLAQRILAKPAANGQPGALELSGVGAVSLEIKEFSAPLAKLSGADALAAVKARLGLNISNLGIKPSDMAGEQPVQVSRGVLDVKLDGANPPQVDVNASLSHEGSPFDVTGQLRLDGITGGKVPQSAAGAAQIIAFKPSGKVEVKNAPRSLANLVPAAAMAGTKNDPSAPNSPVTTALRESIGRSASLTLTTEPQAGAQNVAIKLTTEAGGVGADIGAKLTDKSLTVGTLAAFVGMDPRTVNPVLASANKPAAGAAAAAPIQLGQPFKVSLTSSEPITVPLKPGTFEPDYAGASDATIKITADNDIAIENVPTGADASGNARTTSVRVRSLKADVKAPISGLAESGRSKRFSATFGALAVRGSAEGGTIADISGNASATMAYENPDATIKLSQIDCAVVENLIGKPGLLTGALGDKAEANLVVKPTGSGAAAGTSISATLTAPNVTDAKFDLAMTADRMAITKPSTITWRPDPVFLNKTVLAPAPGTAVGASTIAATKISPLTINISKLSLASSKMENGVQTGGPLKPGVFELDASVTSAGLELAATSAAAGNVPASVTPIKLDGLRVGIRQQAATGANAAAGGEIVADLTIDRVTGGGTPGATGAAAAPKKSTATVRITNLADARGVLTTNAAILNLDADLAAFPTPIVDQLAKQKGVLVELLGPTIDVQAQGRNLSAGGGADLKNASGSLQVKASSARASAEINGDIQQGVFKQTGPITARITQISPQLIKTMGGAVPLVDTVEKTAQDEPGKFDGKGLSVPLDGDISKLAGDLEISPGVARFTTKSIFSTIIESLGGNSGGAIGQRLEPFKVHADRGVLTYERFTLPVGQFNVETRGTVDLVRRQMDVVTYAPLGALTDKALGQLNTGIAGKLGLFDKLTMVPITTKGPIDGAKTELDLGLFAKEQGDKLLKEPGKLIENVLDLFGKNKGGGDPAPTPAPAPVAPTTPKQPSSTPPATNPAPKPATPPATSQANPSPAPTNPAPTNPAPTPKPKPKPKPAQPPATTPAPTPTPTPPPKP